MQCSTASRALASKSIPGFNRPYLRVDYPCINFLALRQISPPTHLNLRLRCHLTLQFQKLITPSAAKTNPPSGSSDEADTETPRGPPLLTILAGLLVFLAVCWIIGSIVLWFFSLFLPSK